MEVTDVTDVQFESPDETMEMLAADLDKAERNLAGCEQENARVGADLQAAEDRILALTDEMEGHAPRLAGKQLQRVEAIKVAAILLTGATAKGPFTAATRSPADPSALIRVAEWIVGTDS
jgi:hypothetical protein